VIQNFYVKNKFTDTSYPELKVSGRYHRLHSWRRRRRARRGGGGSHKSDVVIIANFYRNSETQMKLGF